MLCLACGIPPRRGARRVGDMRSAPPISSSVIRTPISADAYGAVAVSSMRLLLEAQGGPQARFFLCLDPTTLKRLMAAKKRSEDLSDVVTRMTEAEAMASGRISLASGRLTPQSAATYRHNP
jgi:hypothetical protein